MFTPSYKRFVAWRYLLERDRNLSAGILIFVGACVWVSLGMAAAGLWFPMADAQRLSQPSVPVWLVTAVGMSMTLPVLCLLGAIGHRIWFHLSGSSRGWCLGALHGTLVTLALLAVYGQLRGGEAVPVSLAGARLSILVAVSVSLLLAVPLLWFLRAATKGSPRAVRSPLRWGLAVAFVFGEIAVAVAYGDLLPRTVLQDILTIACLALAFGVPVLWLLGHRWAFYREKRFRAVVLAMVVGIVEVPIIALAQHGLRHVALPTLFAEKAPLGSVSISGAQQDVWQIVCGVFVLFALVAVGYAILSRTLRKRGHSSAATVAIGAVALVLASLTGVVFHAGIAEVTEILSLFHGWEHYQAPMELAIPALIAGALVPLALLLLLVRYTFSFFTTVSIGGVTIGTMALIIVLSVMSGFENDLRRKILGFNAHIQVSHSELLQFGDYQKVEEVLATTKGVMGYTPFLTTEVYISDGSNYRNVLFKGIDPERIASVTEIVHKLEEGDERALEKLWPLGEDGSIVGRPARDAAPSGVAPNTEPPGDDDNWDDNWDDPPIDYSGGVDEIVDDEADAGVLEELENPLEEDWDMVVPASAQVPPEVAVLDGVLVGKELNGELHLYTNQEVRAISPLMDANSVPRVRDFRIAGTFYSGMYEYDLKYVYCGLGALQDFLEIGDEVNGIEIRVNDPTKTGTIVAALKERLGPEFRVQDWKELNRALFSALKLEKIAMGIVLVIIILVASFSIVGNLIMLVVEKAKEIAILKTLGSSDDDVIFIFIIQGLMIGLVGALLGTVLGLTACWYGMTQGIPLNKEVYYFDTLPIEVEPATVFLVAVAGIVISVVATLYPAFIAARMRPVKGLRWD